MDVCICKESAVEFWRVWRVFGSAGLSEMGIRPSQRFVRSWQSCILEERMPVFETPTAPWVRRLFESEGRRLSAPVEFYASEGTQRSFSQSRVSKALPSQVHPRDIVAVNEHVYVATPELGLMTTTRDCCRSEALHLINEFCGTYAINVVAPKGFVPARPVTSRGALLRFCDAHLDWTPALLFRTTADHAIDNCASPAESTTALLLCLPVRDGGYGLPLPQMNSVILPNDRAKRLADRGYYVGDAVWPDSMTIVEYDSKAEHTDCEAVTHDHVRKLALESCGYHVSVVTPVILADSALFEKVALDTARRVGHRFRLRTNPSTYRAKQREVREALISIPKRWWISWDSPTGAQLTGAQPTGL